MAFQDFVESLRTMIVSHREHDEEAFRHGAESIIRSLTVQNRPSEARALREAMRAKGKNGKNGSHPTPSALPAILPLSMATRHAPSLVSFIPTPVSTHLVLPPETKACIERVLREHRSIGRLAEAGLKARSKLLFWGPPGCGKTATAQWLAQQLGLAFGVVRLSTLITSYVGETGANVQKVLQTASQTPMVLLIDEADAIAKSRDDDNDVGELRRVVNVLLQSLDSFSSNQSIVVLASNHTHLFDNAVWRRLDDVVEFPLPSDKDRVTLLKHLTNGLKLRGSLSSISKHMAGYSFAEVERAVFEVAKVAIIEKRAFVNSLDILRAGQSLKKKILLATKRSRTRGSK